MPDTAVQDNKGAASAARGPASSFLPSPDLLDQVQGIESTLRRGRKFGGIGSFLLLTFSLVQIALAIYSTTITHGAGTLDPRVLARQWPLWTGIGFLLLLVALRIWWRFWLQESKTAFRYTYSIEPFESIDTPSSDLPWLTADISRRLSERIRRLTRLDDEFATTNADADQSHVHISGSYGLRLRRQSAGDETAELRESRSGDGHTRPWQIEVLPWVRIGQPGAPAKLAHRVTYRSSEWGRKKPKLSDLETDDYEKLVERVYFSIATEIYRQIREDVQRKIDLLPGRRFRATAYFYEAEDYVRSNTLDAYSDAADLYRRVIELYDPEWVELPTTAWRRLVKLAERKIAAIARRIRIRGSLIWPRMARIQLMVARAYLGYANAEIYKHNLASLYGQRVNPVFETKPAVLKALHRLEPLPSHVEGLREAKFDALVTKALMNSVLSAPIEAMDNLDTARASEPLRAEQDSRYLFVRGYVEPDLIQSLEFLRRAVDLDPEYEVAQFELAKATEMLWRTRPRLEIGVAISAIQEYERVVDLNPGNIAAWASLAYINWLLAVGQDRERRLARADQLYERAREYKEIKRATFVAQLDYGKARIAAERGLFRTAYQHYIDAVSASMSQGVSHGPQDDERETMFISDAMVERFANYLGAVEIQFQKANKAPDNTGDMRLRNSVLAFVLTDYGRACFSHYYRTADSTSLEEARVAFHRASTQKDGSRYVLTHFYQHLMKGLPGGDGADYVGEHIFRVDDLDPNWVDGNLALVRFSADRLEPLKDRWMENYRSAAGAAAFAKVKRLKANRLRSKAGVMEQTQGDQVSLDVEAQAKETEDRASSFDQDVAKLEAEADVLAHEWTDGALKKTAWKKEELRRQMQEWSSRIDDAQSRRGDALIARQEAEELRHQQPTELNPLTIARDLDREAADSDINATIDRDWADRCQFSVLELVDRVPRRMQNLLPHASLWGANGEFSIESFERAHDGELKWERNFAEFHVEAIKAWSERQRDDLELRTLLHIRRHFRAQEHVDIFRCLELLAKHESEGRNADRIKKDVETMRGIFKRWLQTEPEYWRMTWILSSYGQSQFFTPEEKIALLSSAAQRRHLAPALVLWLVDQVSDLAPQKPGEALGSYAEARERLKTAARGDLLFGLAESLYKHEHIGEAVVSYRDAADTAPESARKGLLLKDKRDDLLANCSIGIAQASWREGNEEAVLVELERLAQMDLPAGWRSRIFNDTVDKRRASSVMLRIWLDKEAQRRKTGDDKTREDIAGAMRAALRMEREIQFGKSASDSLRPFRTPIFLEAHEEFFRQGADTPQVVRMLADSGLKAMRGRLEQRYGLRVPGTRIRPHPNLPPGRYRIELNEIPRSWGSLEPTTDYDKPLTEALERCLSENLDAFLGLQEVSDMLAQWRLQIGAREVVYRRIASNPRNLILFTEILRELVRDQICLEPLADVIEPFLTSLNGNLEQIEMHVRATLSAERLGFNRAARQLHLPHEVETKVVQLVRLAMGGRNGVSADRESTERDLRQRVLRVLDAERDGQLVVREPSIRRTVRNLIRAELPFVAVLTQDEMAHGRGNGSAG